MQRVVGDCVDFFIDGVYSGGVVVVGTTEEIYGVVLILDGSPCYWN